MLDIQIQSIPPEEQRYDTLGDYWFEDDNWQVRVSETGDWKSEFLVALHELVEMALCKDRGIPEKVIKRFDENFEGQGEPGNSDLAPYEEEHRFATHIERAVAKELGYSWDEYGDLLENVERP